MFEFLSGCESGVVIAYLLAAAVGLSLLWIILMLLIRASINAGSKKTYNAQGKEETSGCCTFPFFVLVCVLIALYNVVTDAINSFDGDKFSDKVLAMHQADAEQFGVISVFRKERVRLYQYYSELKQRRQQCKDYIRDLEAKRAELSFQQAKDAITSEIRNVEKETESIDNILESIEELAGRLYFARLMQNLGVNTNYGEFEGEVDHVQKQSEHAIKNQTKLKK